MVGCKHSKKHFLGVYNWRARHFPVLSPWLGFFKDEILATAMLHNTASLLCFFYLLS